MARIFLGTGGVFTPRQGCSAVSWSLNAVVKIADRIAKQDRITVGGHPAGFQVGDPFPDVDREDLDQAHGAEHGQDVFAEVVGVILPGAGLHLVMRQPLFLDVAGELLAPAARVPESAFADSLFGLLPRPRRLLRSSEGASGALPAFHVAVQREVARLPVAAAPGSDESHPATSSMSVVSAVSTQLTRFASGLDGALRP